MEALIVLAVLAAWGSGYAACHITHREKGIEVDDWNVVIPSDPRDLAEV
jgi:hypothetical protein